MAEDRPLSSEEFTIRAPLFRYGAAVFLAGILGGLLLDAMAGNRLAIALDSVTLLTLLLVILAVTRGVLDRTKAVAILVYAGALNFVLALVQFVVERPEVLAIAVYNNLFILALFLGIATFLVGRQSTLLFGGVLLAVLVSAAWFLGVTWIRDNLWFEVPAVVGSTYLLYRYRGAMDRLLGDLQKVIRENRALRDRERLAALGEMTAGIAHEIKNPLNFVVNFAESSQELLQDLEDLLAKPAPTEADQDEILFLMRELRQNLSDIRDQGLRGADTVQTMLVQARSGTGEFQAVDLNELAAECLHLASWGHPVPSVRKVFKAFPEPVVVKGSRGDLSRALLNLIGNALWSVGARQKHSGPGYEPWVSVEVSVKDTWARVDVDDNGLGLTQQVKSQLFVPFFTTKPAGEGTGLGLPLTREVVVDQHGGRLDVEGEPDQGARFTMRLPLLGATS